MLSTGNAEIAGVYHPVDHLDFDMPDVLIMQEGYPNFLVIIDNFIPINVINLMREELDKNIHCAMFERDVDDHGTVQERWKLFDPLYGKYVAIQLLCSGALQDVVASINDYAYRMFFAGYTKDFEWAYGRYSGGGGYRWHHDMPPMRTYFRLLNFSLYLTEDCGGALEINDNMNCDTWRNKDWLNEVEATVRVEPKIGRLVMMPSYYLHRVTPSTNVREVLFGHVSVSHNYDYDLALRS
jgi:hypothetical protein